tara:strand:- start:648 stop:830 length:183 start_codon:yes stop_codon:yes gene_type:complete
MKVKELIKELQQVDQDKDINIFIPKVFGKDNPEDIWHDDLSHVVEQDENVELYFNKREQS